jgi:hypothetical protein
MIEKTTRTRDDYFGMLRQVANLALMRNTTVHRDALDPSAWGQKRHYISDLLD